MDLFAVEKKEYRGLDIVTVAVDPVMAAATGQINDLEILFMFMGRGDQCSLSERFDLYVLFRTDLVLGGDALFQR